MPNIYFIRENTSLQPFFNLLKRQIKFVSMHKFWWGTIKDKWHDFE
jgi:hypothetical protein